MSGQDIIEFRITQLEKSNEKQSEILDEIVKQNVAMQTKFIILGIIGSSVIAGVVSLVFMKLGVK